MMESSDRENIFVDVDMIMIELDTGTSIQLKQITGAELQPLECFFNAF